MSNNPESKESTAAVNRKLVHRDKVKSEAPYGIEVWHLTKGLINPEVATSAIVFGPGIKNGLAVPDPDGRMTMFLRDSLNMAYALGSQNKHAQDKVVELVNALDKSAERFNSSVISLVENT